MSIVSIVSIVSIAVNSVNKATHYINTVTHCMPMPLTTPRMMAVGGASRRLILLNVDKEGSAAPSTLVSEEEMYLGASKGKPKWKPTPPPPEFSFDDPGSDDGESDDED